MAAPRTLWAALVGLYDETLIMVGANLAALALNLPLGAVVVAVLSPWFADENGLDRLVALVAWWLLFAPSPGNLALAAVSRVAAGPDAPRFALFRENLRPHLSLGLRSFVLSVVVTVALFANVVFYAGMEGWLRFASILWLYAAVLWVGLHMYVAPLTVHVTEPRLFDLYRRAAFISLGHLGYTLILVVLLLAVGLVTVVFVPAYVLVGGAFVSLAQAHALREIRRRHGDLVVEPEEEISRL